MTASGGPPSSVTSIQAEIHRLYVGSGSMSDVARRLGISQIRVREALVQYQRNVMRDAGVAPPPLREMLRGGVAARFVGGAPPRAGRPAKHHPIVPIPPIDASTRTRWTAPPRPRRGRRSLLVTAAEAGAPVHAGFWRNCEAYAAHLGAEPVVVPVGSGGLVAEGCDAVRSRAVCEPLFLEGEVDVAVDAAPPLRSERPLDAGGLRRSATWTLAPHPALQLETLARLRAEGLRVQMTTGATTLPRGGDRRPGARELGAVVVEFASDGGAHCRHVVSDPAGDGSFQDMDRLVRDGAVVPGRAVEALSFGDVHHAHLDPAVEEATWGRPADGVSLVDSLRPRMMLFHDLVDFAARSPFEASDPHRRFELMSAGRGCVRSELAAAASFLARTARPWARSTVVSSNHDARLRRWLRDADHRADPVNALFYLEASLELYRMLAGGGDPERLFERTLRRLSPDGLPGIEFLPSGASLRVAGVECGLHGHEGPDGRRGGMAALEGLRTPVTIGHVHRPTTRGGVCAAGVCQTELAYARGPLTAWAVGHVVTYAGGGRAHLLMNRGRFHA